MCGRYVVTSPVSKTKKIVKSAIKVEDIENYNAHPYQNLPVIKKYSNGNTLENLKWGIIPSWSKNKDFKPLINARLETIDTKPSFSKPIKSQRCVVIADGFYEWKRDDKIKIPFYFYRIDKKTVFLAGIYEKNSFCLITEQADPEIEKIHFRQPVILFEEDIEDYLNLKNNGSDLLKKRNKPLLTFHKISNQVNSPKNNNELLIKEI